MDLIPIISNVILYFLLALVVVIGISFIFFKLIKPSDETEELSINEKRAHIRQYIANQRKYISTSAGTKSSQLNYRIYNAPTYSNNKINPGKSQVNYDRTPPHHLRKTSLPNTKTTVDSQRYTIINQNGKTDTKTNEQSNQRSSYSPFKELHHYQY